jgi:hypothetical protein
MRVESGRIPDVETFGKLCKWLGVNPGDYLGTSTAISAPLENPVVSFSNSAAPLVVSAHFRVDRLPKPEVAQALAKMILFAVNRQKPTETLDGA